MDNINTTELSSESFSIREVLSETVAYISKEKHVIFDSLKYPALGMLLVSLFTTEEEIYSEIISSIWFILYFYFYILLIVKCHRLFLLNESSGTLKESLVWSRKHTNFTLIMFGVGMGLVFSGVLIAPLLSSFLPSIIHFNMEPNTVFYIAMLPAGYIFARLSLMFPSIAIGNNISFSHAWNISSNYGFKLIILLLVIPWTLNFIFSMIDNSQIVFAFLPIVLNILIMIFEIIILSNVYKKLNTMHGKT